MGLCRNAGGGVFVLLWALSLLTPRGESMTTATLSALQSSSGSGVIRLNDTLLRGILSLPSPRPFHFMVFFDAYKFHSRSQLSLPTLKSEFSLVSSSFLSNNPGNNKSLLFFFDVEVEESQTCFALFGVTTLPHIRLIPSTAADMKTDSIKLDASQFSELADSMAELIISETSLSVGRINRPPLLSKAQMMIAIGIAVIWAPHMVKMIVSGKSIWMAGAIFVYFLSVSGTMYNIIRKAPMFIEDRRDREKLVFFYKGAGMQLGAEGLAVGFLYTTVGVLLAFLCHVLVRFKSQRLCMILVLFVSFWAVREVIKLNYWKTGYHIHAYWPSTSTSTTH
ncbi:Oligosaccharyltransferase complex/magnesium transporter family protein [Perilla frutescens var. frutescens]|nr:Oligosaccharyltransferase complex/magnesium transporter family protein [Perilla frutescens var. frutescens]